MYKVPHGPNRIIRTRRDLSQKLENLDQNREVSRRTSEEAAVMSSPRPVFQPMGGGGKGGRPSNGRSPPHDTITPQHEELIRFFHDSWGRVCKEMEMGKQNGHDGRAPILAGNVITYYQEKNEHPALQDFKPFDLEAWWGKRIYQNLTQST